uniref:Uncharacterized protein n=1 Tax=Heterorhabditis bacteriophora TaxID=37862 RepID=A0A1I7WBY3_HETBA
MDSSMSEKRDSQIKKGIIGYNSSRIALKSCIRRRKRARDRLITCEMFDIGGGLQEICLAINLASRRNESTDPSLAPPEVATRARLTRTDSSSSTLSKNLFHQDEYCGCISLNKISHDISAIIHEIHLTIDLIRESSQGVLAIDVSCAANLNGKI